MRGSEKGGEGRVWEGRQESRRRGVVKKVGKVEYGKGERR